MKNKLITSLLIFSLYLINSSFAESVNCRVYGEGEDDKKVIYKISGKVVYRTNKGEVFIMGIPPKLTQKRIIKTKNSACVSEEYEILEDLRVVPKNEVEDILARKPVAEIENNQKKETLKERPSPLAEKPQEEEILNKKGVLNLFMERIRQDE